MSDNDRICKALDLPREEGFKLIYEWIKKGTITLGDFRSFMEAYHRVDAQSQSIHDREVVSSDDFPKGKVVKSGTRTFRHVDPDELSYSGPCRECGGTGDEHDGVDWTGFPCKVCQGHGEL